jgi:hypothetical protein
MSNIQDENKAKNFINLEYNSCQTYCKNNWLLPIISEKAWCLTIANLDQFEEIPSTNYVHVLSAFQFNLSLLHLNQYEFQNWFSILEKYYQHRFGYTNYNFYYLFQYSQKISKLDIQLQKQIE